ncbi:MAG: cupin domain-containing protein [Proteobacteria bacterium]|nr:cupin domain-containing protein [Pseudomonadota bacterium]
MKFESKIFMSGKEMEIEDLGQGVKRQLLGYNDEILMAKVWFEEGSEGYVHSHVHSQSSYVESGKFDVNIAGEIKTLVAGDAFYIPPHVSHGAVCKKAGVLIDVFSPIREDFLRGDKK